MKYLLITLLLIYTTSMIVPLESGCDCAELTYDLECSFLCKWNSSTQVCSDLSCSEVEDIYACLIIEKCAWSNSGRCADFTKCTDYTVTDPELCYYQSSECQGTPVQSGSQYVCQPTSNKTYVTCSTLTSEATCQGNESSTTICAWKAGATTPSCVALSFDSCSNSSQFSKQYCLDDYCTWNSATKVCSELTCTDLELDDCVYVPILPGKSYTPCKLSGGMCVEAQDMDHLSETDCFAYSLLQYHWDPNTSECTSCSNSSADFVVANIVLLLALGSI